MKIDLGELYKNKATLDSSVKNVKSTIQSARDYLQALADSEALQGKVKTAIDAKLKNHQIPLMTNYLTALSVLSKDYTTLLQTFKDTVGEKSNRAIIDTDALRDLKKPFVGIEQGLSVIQRDTAAIYESIADIIELANPSTSKVIQDLHAAKQVLTDTESKMVAFNQLQSRSSFEEMMAAQTKELRQLSALQDLGYTNKKAMSYYQRTDFATSVEETSKKSNSHAYQVALQNELAKKLKTSKYSGKISSQSYTYNFKEMKRDFVLKIKDYSEWNKEALGSVLEYAKDKVIKEGKNLGRALGAKLQPRSAGKFIKDTFAPRRWLSGKLKGMSSTASKFLGHVAKWGGRGLVAWGAYEEGKEHYEKYHNVGRAFAYGITAGAAGWGAGIVGSAVAGSLVTGVGLTGLATVAAPIAGAVVVGAAVSVGVKALYKNVKPFRQAVDSVGDIINDVGRAFKNPLKSIKGGFG